jgi:hypothetical protein
MIDGTSRSGGVAIGVLKALHLLKAENKPTTLDAICDWLTTTENIYYDDWLTVGGRGAKQYIADILEDLRELNIVRTVDQNTDAIPQSNSEWITCLPPQT